MKVLEIDLKDFGIQPIISKISCLDIDSSLEDEFKLEQFTNSKDALEKLLKYNPKIKSVRSMKDVGIDLLLVENTLVVNMLGNTSYDYIIFINWSRVDINIMGEVFATGKLSAGSVSIRGM